MRLLLAGNHDRFQPRGHHQSARRRTSRLPTPGALRAFLLWWGAPRNLVDVVLDGGDPAIEAADGVAVTVMIEATERSIAEGRPVQIAELIGA